MEERVVRLLVEVVELEREVKEMRREVGEERAEDAAGDARVLAVVLLVLAVGLGHLVQGWWGRRAVQHRAGGGQGEAMVEVVTVGRAEEAAVTPPVVGEDDLERVEVVREGGTSGVEGVEGRGGRRGGRGRGEAGGVRDEAAQWWRCLLLSQK